MGLPPAEHQFKAPIGARFGPRQRRRLFWGAMAMLAASTGGYALWGALTRSSNKGPSAPPGIPVVASPATQGDIGVYLTGLGTVTSLRTVTVRTRVDGELMSVSFKEGQMVTEGDVLAQIDPRPFQAQFTLAQGQLLRDQASLENARRDLNRYRILFQQDSISQQQYDTQQALVRQLEGTIKSDRGQLYSARIQLNYARVTAPISGRIGLRLVDPGNIVHASDQGLAVITQTQPITMVFSIAQDHLPALLEKVRTGQRLPVIAYNREFVQKIAEGTLLTVDNQIDPSTGTIRLKAIFDNKDGALFPSQFVNARLLLEVLHDQTLAPMASIQRGAQKTFVYVVKPDQVVESRDVQTGPAEGGQIAIVYGLSPGENVVVDGADKLREGSKVILRGQGGSGQGGNGAAPQGNPP